MKFYLISLGCPKNLTDSEDFCARLLAVGHQMVFDINEADTIFINTCGFLASSIKEAEQNIKMALKLKNKGAIKKVFITGCMVERLGEKIKEKFPEIDLIFSVKAQENVEKILRKSGCYLPKIPKVLKVQNIKKN